MKALTIVISPLVLDLLHSGTVDRNNLFFVLFFL